MVENVKHVRNPLTIVAIFAGVTEISGSVILPLMAQPQQGTFLWFVMLFPFTLLILFFLTLHKNHKVLYAPSDFRDDKSFLDLVTQLDPGQM